MHHPASVCVISLIKNYPNVFVDQIWATRRFKSVAWQTGTRLMCHPCTPGGPSRRDQRRRTCVRCKCRLAARVAALARERLKAIMDRNKRLQRIDGKIDLMPDAHPSWRPSILSLAASLPRMERRAWRGLTRQLANLGRATKPSRGWKERETYDGGDGTNDGDKGTQKITINRATVTKTINIVERNPNPCNRDSTLLRRRLPQSPDFDAEGGGGQPRIQAALQEGHPLFL